MTKKCHTGRPRCRKTHNAIVKASHELLSEIGFEKFTIEGLAERAKVSKATIYRRWTNKTALLLDLVLLELKEVPLIIPNACIEDNLKRRILLLRSIYQGYLGGAMIHIIAATHSDPHIAEQFSQHYVQARRKEIKEILECGIQNQELPKETNQDLFIDMLFGAMFYKFFMSHSPASDQEIDDLIRLAITSTR